MAISKKKIPSVRSSLPRQRRTSAKAAAFPKAGVLAFLTGIATMGLVMASMAILLERAWLPLHLVPSLAIVAVSVGTAVAGGLLATLYGRRCLLCGLGCGAFYAICIMLAALIRQGTLSCSRYTISLVCALLLSGVIGSLFPIFCCNRHAFS